MTSYGSKAYWEKYYKSRGPLDDEAVEEWICSKSELAEPLNGLLAARNSILVLGCGLSVLPEQLYDEEDCRDITCVDWNEAIINSRIEKNSRLRAGLQYHTADITEKFPFKNCGYDVIIDKATYDCVKSREDSAEASLRLLKHVHDLLRPGGLYLMISTSGPDERLSDLGHEDGPRWGKVEMIKWAIKASLHDVKRGKVADGNMNRLKWNDIAKPDEPGTWEEGAMFLYGIRKGGQNTLEEKMKVFDGV